MAYRPHFVSSVSFCFFSSHQTMMHGKRSSQLDPAIPPRQRHISGPMRLPPRRHFGLHTAGRRNCYQQKWKSRVRETLIIDAVLETDYPKSSDQPPFYSQSDCPYKITSDPQVTYIVSTGHDDSKNNGYANNQNNTSTLLATKIIIRPNTLIIQLNS